LESLAQKTTWAPFLARRRDVEKPMPSLPPVTRTTFPLKSGEKKEETEIMSKKRNKVSKIDCNSFSLFSEIF
jgi:hypothetical protein